MKMIPWPMQFTWKIFNIFDKFIAYQCSHFISQDSDAKSIIFFGLVLAVSLFLCSKSKQKQTSVGKNKFNVFITFIVNIIVK